MVLVECIDTCTTEVTQGLVLRSGGTVRGAAERHAVPCDPFLTNESQLLTARAEDGDLSLKNMSLRQPLLIESIYASDLELISIIRGLTCVTPQ